MKEWTKEEREKAARQIDVKETSGEEYSRGDSDLLESLREYLSRKSMKSVKGTLSEVALDLQCEVNEAEVMLGSVFFDLDTSEWKKEFATRLREFVLRNVPTEKGEQR